MAALILVIATLAAFGLFDLLVRWKGVDSTDSFDNTSWQRWRN